MPAASGRQSSLTKRACDSCRVRKIKCLGQSPCQACVASNVQCTFLQQALTRGAPPRLRTKTREAIEKIQQAGAANTGTRAASSSSPTSASTTSSSIGGGSSWGKASTLGLHQVTEQHPDARPTSPVPQYMPNDVLALQLYNYRTRLYPVWPVVHIDLILADIQGIDTPHNLESYALATAVSAATIAQLRLPPATYNGRAITADEMATECLRVLPQVGYQENVNLTSIRIAFFMHVYHENKDRGGSKSWLYLREAISMAQILRLGRESTYTGLHFEEEQLTRRIYWLLYITERGVSILHKLPVTLSAAIHRPKVEGSRDPAILPAFLSLVDLFYELDQTGLYSLVVDLDSDGVSSGNQPVMYNEEALRLLQWKLHLFPSTADPINDVQKADIYITKFWAQAILWRLANFKLHDSTIALSPVELAKSFLGVISKLPKSALESHGYGMELKINEIANTVADAETNYAVQQAPASSLLCQNFDVLFSLSEVLSSLGKSGEALREKINRTVMESSYTAFTPLFTQSDH